MIECLNVMAEQIRRLGGEVKPGNALQAELVTPYGPVRLDYWRGDVAAYLVAFPTNHRAAWYGFERWKVIFRLSNLQAGGMLDDDIADRFWAWLSRFFLPTSAGFPVIPDSYASIRPFMLSMRHLSLFVVWPVDVLTSPTAIAVRLVDQPGPAADWLQHIHREAIGQKTNWVVFTHHLEPDSRFEIFEVQNG